MKALILDGSPRKETTISKAYDYLEECLKNNNYETKVRTLREEKIAPCLGCFGCWLKTPGQCIIKDDASTLPRDVIQSNVLVDLTPVTFGMYSSELKKAIDRYACPILLPFFEKVNGEIHHNGRYEKYPNIIAIGTLENQDCESEKTFKTLVARNAINLHTKASSCIVYSSDKPEAIRLKIDAILPFGGEN